MQPVFTEKRDWDGVASARPARLRKAFELMLDRVLGERILADGGVAVELWSALANVEWQHADGGAVSYSFRSAGDLIAWLREEGSYLDWYCCAEPGVVSTDIQRALAAHGWTPKVQ